MGNINLVGIIYTIFRVTTSFTSSTLINSHQCLKSENAVVSSKNNFKLRSIPIQNNYFRTILWHYTYTHTMLDTLK